MTWIERTAYPRLPRAVSLKELRESFTPGEEEMAWARARTRSDRHLLALLVALKCYQRLGYFPPAAAIPAPVIDHVRATAGLDADVAAEYDVGRTGPRHRDYVRARLGVVWEPARVRAVCTKQASNARQVPGSTTFEHAQDVSCTVGVNASASSRAETLDGSRGYAVRSTKAMPAPRTGKVRPCDPRHPSPAALLQHPEAATVTPCLVGHRHGG